MVAFLAQELVWGIFTECKLCNTAMAAQFGDRLGPISCFLKVLPFPSYRRGSVMATWVHFPSGTTWMPLFSDHFSTPLVSESATTLLPSSAVFPPRRGNWAAQDTNVMEGEPEASHGFTQYSWIAQSLETRGSQRPRRCHCGQEGSNVQFTVSTKMIFSNWPFLSYPKGVAAKVTWSCLATQHTVQSWRDETRLVHCG